MANNQNNDFQVSDNQETLDNKVKTENKGFKVTNQGQNLGGGKGQSGGQKIGQFADDDDFSTTDQTITQAAPGQTTTATDQGSSNA
ncbi:MAG: hypothetical protein LC768_17615 [Acidobacteria bacterium]|nr:hypothetical protein [Acidobacteriota bacterium]MCA1640112.1 hypothetical protein [Acidobacteriota bacterium]